ncbi:S-RNase, partial [Trifolium medium]|nr:S-RNase [Trifolium medium]
MNDWPSLNAGESDFDFWSEEYSRYGKCGLDYFRTPDRYFTRAIIENGAIDITKVLADKGILADNDRTYSVQQLFQAIEDRGLNRPQIE